MNPDDPRHASYAGYMAHKKDGERACDACMTAHRRQTKAAKMRLESGVRNRIPLGVEAWRVLDTRSRRAVSDATGLAENNLRVMHRGGPGKIVLRSTRDSILGAGSRTPTYVGVQRRLRALAAMGYAMSRLAPMIGAHPDPLVRMMRRKDEPEYVRAYIVDGVLRVYEQFSMKIPPAGPVATRQRTMAARRGWVPPLAWDDIDDRNEVPAGRVPTDRSAVDEAVVLRLLDGDTTVPATRAEKIEAMRRWLARGNSEASFCALHGWKDGRYVTREDTAA